MDKQMVFARSASPNQLGIGAVSRGWSEPFGAYIAHIQESYHSLAEMTYFLPGEGLTEFNSSRIVSSSKKLRSLGIVKMTENFGLTVVIDDGTDSNIVVSGQAVVVFLANGNDNPGGGGGGGNGGSGCAANMALLKAWEEIFTSSPPDQLTYAVEPSFAIPRENLLGRSREFWIWLGKVNGVGPVTPWALGRLWIYIVGDPAQYPVRIR